MSRTSFELQPVDGARDPRQASRIVNQAMTGKINAVRDFTIDQTELQAGAVTVTDQRISAQSYLSLMPLNSAANAADLVFLGQTKGRIAFEAPPISAQTGRAQAIADQTADPQAIGAITPTELAIIEDPNLSPLNMSVGATDITTQTFGSHSISFAGGGLPGQNVNINVGLHIDPDGTATNDYYVDIEIARTNVFFSWGMSFIANMRPGGLIAGVMLFSSASTLTDYSYVLTVEDTVGLSPLPIDLDPNDDLGLGLNQPLEYRMLIIG